MKIFFLSVSLLVSAVCVAQPKLIPQAVISTTTNVIAPEEEDVSQIQNQGGGGGFNFRNFGDGETKTTTYIKNEMVKTNFKSESFRGSVYRNNTAKTTTTIFEMMGNKMGFVATDEDQVMMRKRADSMMKERAKTDTGGQRRVRTLEQPAATVAYTEESKKIAGYNCKKAYIITDRLFGKDSMAVWYTPEIKFEGVSSTGGTSGLGNMGGGTNNFDKVDGFVMQYERNMPRGRKMEVKVTKIETDKSIDEKEFALPKDVEIKTMKEMTEGGGGMMRMMRQQ
ncbi:MAG: hypothetical protein WKF88_08560 [Ferruginibacter sp.]